EHARTRHGRTAPEGSGAKGAGDGNERLATGIARQRRDQAVAVSLHAQRGVEPESAGVWRDSGQQADKSSGKRWADEGPEELESLNGVIPAKAGIQMGSRLRGNDESARTARTENLWQLKQKPS